MNKYNLQKDEIDINTSCFMRTEIISLLSYTILTPVFSKTVNNIAFSGDKKSSKLNKNQLI